jgi:hypothetical protein
MSDISPYGVTQNPDAAAVTANQLVGSPVGSTRENAAIEGVGPAFLSTAPYVSPVKPRGGYCCKGKNDTCMAAPIRGTDYCVFHSQKKASGEPSDSA